MKASVHSSTSRRSPRPRSWLRSSLILLLAATPGSSAQTLSDVLPGLFEQAATLSDPAGFSILLDVGVDPNGVDHSFDFYSQAASDRVRQVGGAVNRRIGAEFGTPWLADYSSGQVFDWQPNVGRFERSSTLFGSPFARRPDSQGQGMWSVSFGYSKQQFDELDEGNIDQPGLDFNLRQADPDGDGLLQPYWEGDLIRVQTSLALTQEVASLQVRAGATERLDLGVTVPFVRNELDARMVLTMDRISTSDNLRLHRFLDPRIKDDLVFAGGTVVELEAGGTSSGLGDVQLDAKYHLLDPASGEGGLAVLALVSLPTGDEEEFLGAGATRAQVGLAGSRLFAGRWSPHFDLAQVVSLGESDVVGDLPDETRLTVGLDFVANSRLTLSGDLIARRQTGLTTFDSRDEGFAFALSPLQNAARGDDAACTPASPCIAGEPGSGTNPKPELIIDSDGDATVVRAGLGLRLRPARRAVVSALYVLPLTADKGLVDEDPVAFLGLEWSF